MAIWTDIRKPGIFSMIADIEGESVGNTVMNFAKDASIMDAPLRSERMKI